MNIHSPPPPLPINAQATALPRTSIFGVTVVLYFIKILSGSKKNCTVFANLLQKIGYLQQRAANDS